MTDAPPEGPSAPPAPMPRATAERRLAVKVFAGFWALMFGAELLAGRPVDLLLFGFNTVVAGVIAFVIWLVRDTLHERARRRGGDAAD